MASESDRTLPTSDATLKAIADERGQLMKVAYRLLGSLTEAEDAVQEAYARWYAMSGEEQMAIEAPGAWLTTVASRICLDVLGSARVRRERYVGEWVPEPIPTGHASTLGAAPDASPSDPADRVTLDESISMAFLVVLESMTPAERVSFIMHDVFHYSFAEIADVVGRTPAACRQLASSARHRLDTSSEPTTPSDRQAGVVRGFKQAWDARDIDALLQLLDPDATVITDGGGLVRAVLRPIEGADRIARACIAFARRVPTLTLHETVVNGQPGLIGRQDGIVVTVYAFGVSDGRIKHIWAVRNPEKIRPWTAR